MASERFLVVIDTPGIKQFVFGTDTLAEVRGASALLDRLNRHETVPTLRDQLPACAPVFVNGGTGQLVIEAPSREAVERALAKLACFYQDRTAGEVRIVWGVTPWPTSEEARYQDAVRAAHFQMRLFRETDFIQRSSPLVPLMVECSSSSHLPAQPRPYFWGGEPLMLSAAASLKRDESKQSDRTGPWAGWMEHLASTGPWPERGKWRDLRPGETDDLVKAREDNRVSTRKGYVGLVYADGNAMGRLVQALDSRAAYQVFSEIVDGSIREACHKALDKVCAAEIQQRRGQLEAVRPLPADILLLGGDDLLVLVPADVALTFALHVTAEFEKLTRERIDRLPAGDVRHFFNSKLVPGQGMTISCGVALAPAKYPFYLLRDLAEDLLKNAKRAGNDDPDAKKARGNKSWAPSYVDFHLIVGPAGADLAVVREEDYHVGRDSRPRTLRPYRRDLLEKLRQAVGRLQQARIPRSKLQDLFDAALAPHPQGAQMRSRELFGRLRQDAEHPERRALWDALRDLGMTDDFPWCAHGKTSATALADLVEACDLFPREETT